MLAQFYLLVNFPESCLPLGSIADLKHVRDNRDSDHVAQTVIRERKIGLRWPEQRLPGEQAEEKTAS